MATRRYVAYLLRLWQPSGAECELYGSLEDPHTGQRIGFANLTELVVFLKTQLQEGNRLHTPYTSLLPDCLDEVSGPTSAEKTDQSNP